jgi:hypothetical protein
MILRLFIANFSRFTSFSFLVILKNMKTVTGISMISQFHIFFFKSHFWRVFWRLAQLYSSVYWVKKKSAVETSTPANVAANRGLNLLRQLEFKTQFYKTRQIGVVVYCRSPLPARCEFRSREYGKRFPEKLPTFTSIVGPVVKLLYIYVYFFFQRDNVTIRFRLLQSSDVYWVVVNCKEFGCLLVKGGKF